MYKTVKAQRTLFVFFLGFFFSTESKKNKGSYGHLYFFLKKKFKIKTEGLRLPFPWRGDRARTTLAHRTRLHFFLEFFFPHSRPRVAYNVIFWVFFFRSKEALTGLLPKSRFNLPDLPVSVSLSGQGPTRGPGVSQCRGVTARDCGRLRTFYYTQTPQCRHLPPNGNCPTLNPKP